ncbi:ATP-binding protein [Ruegeria sp.]|uniref:ATP-binding protein n=1 Tax=Ruegeria sp. TaxID=1879320 RepID=UPI003B00A2F8
MRPQQVVAELLTAELAEKTARSIRIRWGAAKFPVCKSLPEFDFTVSPVNEEVVRNLHDGDFMDQARNGVCWSGGDRIGQNASRNSDRGPRGQ